MFVPLKLKLRVQPQHFKTQLEQGTMEVKENDIFAILHVIQICVQKINSRYTELHSHTNQR
jgi:hypothetical protein